jgi:hypothetical protein
MLLGSFALVLGVAGTGPLPVQAAPMNWNHLTNIQKKLASGALEVALAPNVVGPAIAISPGTGSDVNADATDNLPSPGAFTAAPGGIGTSGSANYTPAGTGECSQRFGSNVKVNQNCINLTDPSLQGRGQSQNETSIAIDAMNPKHIIASQNDYRRGDGNCYGAYSLDNGRTWNDTTIPMSFTYGTATWGRARQYWQAGGDTSVAWDTKGNAYFSCQMFNRGIPTSSNPDQSSAFYVFRSTGNFGASWNFPGRPVTEYNDAVGAGNVLEDKQLMTVDNHVGSPFQDRVYVTWTEFAADGSGYIWESFSKDYGEHFSARQLVSAGSSLCTQTFGAGTPHGSCNENQFSQPFTGSDGALYVAYSNYNNTPTGSDNRNQVLLAKSVDGGATFSAPVKVSDYYELPDCPTYQSGKDFGRACVPEKSGSSDSVFRAANYPSAKVNPTDPSQVVVTIGSYVNQHSKESNGCVPAGINAATGNNLYTGVKTPGACNNDILISVSNDHGATFTGAATDPRTEAVVTTASRQATTDQFWQWADFTKDGTLAVSYYDRQYGSDETTGYSDVSLTSGSLEEFGTKRVTSGSMPPPTQFAGLFYGDYTGLAAWNDAHPLWADTRDPELFLCPGTGTPTAAPQVCRANKLPGFSADLVANDQNIYTATESVNSR